MVIYVGVDHVSLDSEPLRTFNTTYGYLYAKFYRTGHFFGFYAFLCLQDMVNIAEELKNPT
jgi:amino acid transporter